MNERHFCEWLYIFVQKVLFLNIFVNVFFFNVYFLCIFDIFIGTLVSGK